MKTHIGKYSALGIVSVLLCTCLARADLILCTLNMSDYDKADEEKFGLINTDHISAVIHESSLGNDTPTGCYGRRRAAALQNHLLWGAYHYCRAIEDPVEQADFFVETVESYHKQQPFPDDRVLLVLDIEYLSSKGKKHYDKYMTPKDAAKCINRVHDITGVWPGIYTGQDFLLEKLNAKQVDKETWSTLNQCWLWVARYSGAYPRFPRGGSPWSYCTMWQYTGDNEGSSIEQVFPKELRSISMKKCELNYVLGYRDQLADWWKKNSWDYHRQNLQASTKH